MNTSIELVGYRVKDVRSPSISARLKLQVFQAHGWLPQTSRGDLGVSTAVIHRPIGLGDNYQPESIYPGTALHERFSNSPVPQCR